MISISIISLQQLKSIDFSAMCYCSSKKMHVKQNSFVFFCEHFGSVSSKNYSRAMSPCTVVCPSHLGVIRFKKVLKS